MFFKIDGFRSGYANTVVRVTLTPEGQRLSDAELITRADNRSCEGEIGPVCHFGGNVVRYPDGRAEIKVYTD
jgi:hypothetical protein